MTVNVDTSVTAGDILPRIYITAINLRDGGAIKHSRKTGRRRRRNLRNKQRSGTCMSVELLLNVQDVVQKDQISTWMFNHNFTKHVNIKIIQSTDPALSKLLSAGKFQALQDPRFKGRFKQRILPIQKSSSSAKKGKKGGQAAFTYTGESTEIDLQDYDSVLSSTGERIYKIPFQTKFIISELQPKHLSYYAFTYLNMESLAKEYGLGFLKKIIHGSMVKGSITGEKVIEDSSVVTSSYTFYEERTGKIWTGPKHKDAYGQWFSGRKGDGSFNRLVRRESINMKINDYRQIETIKKESIVIHSALRDFQKMQQKQLNGDQPAPTIVESYISRGEISPKPNGQVNILFHLDAEKLIKTQSVFGSLVDKIKNQRAKDKIFFLSKIRNLRLVRRRVKNSTSHNRLGTLTKSNLFEAENDVVETIAYSADKHRDRTLKRKNQKNASIREINTLSFSQGVRTFTATDKSMTNITDGYYQYGVVIEMVDGTVQFLNDQADRLSSIRESMLRYYGDATNPKYLNFNGSFSPLLMEKYRKKSKRRKRVTPWTRAIAIYIDVLTSLTTLNSDPRKFARRLYSLINGQSGSPEGIDLFIQMLDQLIIVLDKTLGPKRRPLISAPSLPGRRPSPPTTPGATRDTGSRAPAKSGFKSSLLTVDRYFRDLHDSNTPKNVGLNFLGKKDRQTIGVKAITVKDFFKRIGEENSIYWSDTNLNNVGQTLQGDASIPNTNKSLFNLKANEMSFLSPAEINGGSYSIQRTAQGSDVWSSDKYNAMASNLAAVQSGVYQNVTALGDPSSPAFKKKTRDTKKNNLRGMVHDASVSNLLAQIGVTVLDSIEESALQTIRDSELTEVQASFAFGTSNGATIVTSEEADTTVEFISRRGERKIKKEYSENVKAVGNLFVNLISANGTLNKDRQNMESPSTPGSNGGQISDYDLGAVGDMTDTLKSAAGQTTVSDIPNQIRSLMFSNSSTTNTSFLSAPVDMLKSPESAQMMKNNYDTLAKVEMFMGFSKDTRGNNIIDKPIYLPMSNSLIESAGSGVVLCRIRNYENKALNIGQNNGLNLQIYDTCFLMSTSELNLLLNKKVQLTDRVIMINKAAASTGAALQTSVTKDLLEKRRREEARLAALAAAQLALDAAAALTAAEQTQLDALNAKREKIRAAFSGGGKEEMFDFFFNWLSVNTELNQDSILDFLAIVDIDDHPPMYAWLMDHTSMAYAEVTEFLDMLSTMLFEEVVFEDPDDRQDWREGTAGVFTGYTNLTSAEQDYLIDFLHDRGDMTYDEVEELLRKIGNFSDSAREHVKSQIIAWTIISAEAVEVAMQYIYGPSEIISAAEQAQIDAINAMVTAAGQQTDAITAAGQAQAQAAADAASVAAQATADAAAAMAQATEDAGAANAAATLAAAQAEAQAAIEAAEIAAAATAAQTQAEQDAAIAAYNQLEAQNQAQQDLAEQELAALQALADALEDGASQAEAEVAAEEARNNKKRNQEEEGNRTNQPKTVKAVDDIYSDLSSNDDKSADDTAESAPTEDPKSSAGTSAASASVKEADSAMHGSGRNQGAASASAADASGGASNNSDASSAPKASTTPGVDTDGGGVDDVNEEIDGTDPFDASDDNVSTGGNQTGSVFDDGAGDGKADSAVAGGGSDNPFGTSGQFNMNSVLDTMGANGF